MSELWKPSPNEFRKRIRQQLQAMNRFRETDPVTVDEDGVIRFYTTRYFDLGEPKFDWEKDA